jgi:hypothetical protein
MGNPDCSYCFVPFKEELYPGSEFRMRDDLLTTYLRQLLESHRAPDVTVAWQGWLILFAGLIRRLGSVTIGHVRVRNA